MTVERPVDRSWRGVGRRRLRAPGVRGSDATVWLNRAAVAAIGLAVVWWGYAVLRPLAAPTAASEEAVPAIPAVNHDAAPVEIRSERLARLSEWNVFDAEREAWSGQREKPTEPATADGQPAPAESVKPATRPVPIDGRSIDVTEAEALPSDIKAALTGLMLRGIFAPPGGGEPRALISRVHAGPNPLVSDVFVVGDEFEDAQHPQAKWRVIAIDAAGRRVILQRAGVNAALDMYAAGVTAAAAAPATGAAITSGPTVVIQTKEEAIAVLRAAKIPEEEIARLIELAEMSADDAAAALALEELAKGAPAKAEEGQPARRPPPAGLEAIAKLLQQTPEQMKTKKEEGEEPK